MTDYDLLEGSEVKPEKRSVARNHHNVCPQKISAQSDDVFPKYAV